MMRTREEHFYGTAYNSERKREFPTNDFPTAIPFLNLDTNLKNVRKLIQFTCKNLL